MSFGLQARNTSSARPLTRPLRETALKELQIPQNKGLTSTPSSASEVPATSVLQSSLPEDSRPTKRPSWILSLGLENQKPQGSLPIPSLNSFDLDQLESTSAVTLSLSWYFGSSLEKLWGPRWQAALSAQMGWSFHSYQLELPGAPSSELVKLHVLKPQTDLLIERQVLHLTDWDTEIWMGVLASYGRLIQSQTSQKRDFLNSSLGENFVGTGLQSRALISQQLSLGLHYFYRNFQITKGSTHHAQLSLGIAL
jgi:hypothetical protein